VLIEADIVIVGGGIAGLWTLNTLVDHGYSVVLIEREAFGAGQSIAAQGVIHGGLKYAAGGLLNDASEALAAMPTRWRRCFESSGELDLQNARRLAPCQHLWTRGGGTSAIAGFVASKMLKSRIDKLRREDFPPPLDHSSYRGHVFQLDEFVVDTPTVLWELARPHLDRILHADIQQLSRQGNGHVEIQATSAGGDRISLICRHLVLTAGEGNAHCLEQLGLASELPMQRRPLHQVLVKHRDLPPFYSVCLGTGPKPPLVCTTHYHPDGDPIWYLGGELAESGVTRSAEDQIREADKTLHRLLPWLDLSEATWATLSIDRAEAETTDRNRHPGAWVETVENITTVWPSKLALAPDAADRVLTRVQSATIEPRPTAEAFPFPTSHLQSARSPWNVADFSLLP
jgi:glycerol-3-phosphate dehydrogenase